MIRAHLPAIAICLAGPVAAQQAEICENVPFDTANCVRVLACVGDSGLYFDGQAHGWDTGTVSGALSDGTACSGTWDSTGLPGTSEMTCDDGTQIGVVYTTIDNTTGTVIGGGSDSQGRRIEGWTGTKVLEYLTPDGRVDAELPCGPAPILIS